LGIKSYCFRDLKDNRRVVKMLKQCGVDRLDISGTHFFDIAGPQIGLCMDTAWTLDSGESPSDWIDRFGKRLYAIRIVPSPSQLSPSASSR
jgi:hypothetical protein